MITFKNDLRKDVERTGPDFLNNLIILFFYLLICFQSVAQYTVRIVVTDSSKKNDIFLAGTFNNWNPATEGYY